MLNINFVAPTLDTSSWALRKCLCVSFLEKECKEGTSINILGADLGLAMGFQSWLSFSGGSSQVPGLSCLCVVVSSVSAGLESTIIQEPKRRSREHLGVIGLDIQRQETLSGSMSSAPGPTPLGPIQKRAQV